MVHACRNVFVSAALLLLFPVLSAAGQGIASRTLPLSQFGATTLDLQLAAATGQAQRAGGGAWTFVVDRPGVLAASADLPAGSTLRFQAPVTFARGATIRAFASTHITCAKDVTLRSDAPDARMIQATGDNVLLDHCSFAGAGGAGYALEAAHVRHLRVDDIKALRTGVVVIRGGDDHTITNVAFSDSEHHTTAYGVTIMEDATHVQIRGVRSESIANPVEWFNADGDQNKGGPGSRDAILKHGGWYDISDVHCRHAQACVWGSVAHDISVSNSDAQDTGDVAFDCESCVDAVFQNVRSTNSGSGGGSVFFFVDNVRFTGADFTESNGHPLFSLHNSSGNKAWNTGLRISGSTFTCLRTVCPALASESAQGLQFTGNRLTNAFIGVVGAAAFGSDQSITDNDLLFTLTSPGVTLYAIQPLNLQGGTLRIERNSIRGNAVFAPASACIFVYGSDFNTVTTANIAGNRCMNSGLARDMVTETAGGNPGVGIHWRLSNNVFVHRHVEHRRTAAAFEDWQESGS